MQRKVFDISPPRELKKKEVEGFPLEKNPEFKISSFGSRLKKSLLLIALILIIIGASIHFTFSGIEIEIWPKTDLKTFETKLTVDKKIENINFSDKLIPGKNFEEEKTFSQEFSATGKKLLEKKAEGVIRVFNDSQQDQILITKTRFQPPLEKFPASLETETEKPWFLLIERVVIPAKSYKDVKVVAYAPGEKYNIEPSTFSVPGLAGTSQYTFVYGKSFEPMKGGVKKEVFEVTQEDLKRAEEFLKEKVAKEIKDIIINKISSEFIVLEGTSKTEILATSSVARVETEIEKFTFQVKAKTKIISFKKEDLENFSKEFIVSKIPADKKIDQKSLKIDYFSENINLETGEIVLFLNLEAKIYSVLDEVSLKRALAGKSLTETQFILQNQAEIDRAEIRFFPFWIKQIPEEPERIKVKVNVDPVVNF